ncbi:hypothetical protein ACUIJN_22725 [Metabacillus halosaccharovorans]|uniref:hypothetical protein n=1 Tax=Metabacillus halosaccharovorans TaxID=930124 RepID=UPI00403E12B3
MYLINLKDTKIRSGIPDPVISKLDQWLSNRKYNHRRYILPEYFSDDTYEVDYDTARKAMYWAVKVGALETNYEIHCPRCGERVEVVNRQLDIPDSVDCECGYDFNPWHNQEHIIISFNIRNK